MSKEEFMQATGLRPSSAYSSLFGFSVPDGFDHTLVWLDSNKRYIVTTEPYGIERALRTAARLCWKAVVAPEGVGIWNPPDTTLVILAPSGTRRSIGDPDCVLRDLLASLPTRRRMLG